MPRKLALIDADRLCYLEKEGETLQEVLDKVNQSIKYTLEFTQADAYILFISEGKYFRHDLSSYYKAKRVYTQKWSRAVKAYLKAEYNAVSYKGVEADDSVVYWNNQIFHYGKWLYAHPDTGYSEGFTDKLNHIGNARPVETIIVATDKDILYNIPGKHCNPSKKNKDTGDWETVWIETSINDASLGVFRQLICGDASDGVTGLNRKGEVWCDKNFAGKSLEEVRELVFTEYLKEHGVTNGIYEFQKNYRLLHMLATDEDWLREVGYTPEFPTINLVNKLETNELDLDL